MNPPENHIIKKLQNPPWLRATPMQMRLEVSTTLLIDHRGTSWGREIAWMSLEKNPVVFHWKTMIPLNRRNWNIPTLVIFQREPLKHLVVEDTMEVFHVLRLMDQNPTPSLKELWEMTEAFQKMNMVDRMKQLGPSSPSTE